MALELYTLYTSVRSTDASHVRIALMLKDISVHFHNVDMDALEHESPWYRALNPSGNVPTLVVERLGSPHKFIITQTMAILTFLAGEYRDFPLFPPYSAPRARFGPPS